MKAPGRRGGHFTPSIFARHGHGERAAPVCPEAEDRFAWTEADLDRIEANGRAYFPQ